MTPTLNALWLSVQVTAAATVAILVLGVGFGLFLARTRVRGRVVLETLVNLPLVLPPSVVGYYLLVFLGREGPLVGWFDVNILFTWYAAVIALTIVAIPLM